MKISIGCDHAGPDYKKAIVQFLKDQGHEVTDHGTDSFETTDYADYGHLVATDVENSVVDFGIIICGSGNGINMAANKHKGVRSALCWNREITVLARQHNDANILSIPARFTSIQQAVEMADIFIKTEFEGGRHIKRVQKIPCQ